MVFISNSLFPNAVGMKSQLGFVILLADGQKRANIVHHISTRYHRVSRSVMATEVHALVRAIDIGFVVREAFEKLFGRGLEPEAFVDTRTLFNIIAKKSCTAKRRLQIEVWALTERYRKWAFQSIGWIP